MRKISDTLFAQPSRRGCPIPQGLPSPPSPKGERQQACSLSRRQENFGRSCSLQRLAGPPSPSRHLKGGTRQTCSVPNRQEGFGRPCSLQGLADPPSCSPTASLVRMCNRNHKHHHQQWVGLLPAWLLAGLQGLAVLLAGSAVLLLLAGLAVLLRPGVWRRCCC